MHFGNCYVIQIYPVCLGRSRREVEVFRRSDVHAMCSPRGCIAADLPPCQRVPPSLLSCPASWFGRVETELLLMISFLAGEHEDEREML